MLISARWPRFVVPARPTRCKDVKVVVGKTPLDFGLKHVESHCLIDWLIDWTRLFVVLWFSTPNPCVFHSCVAHVDLGHDHYRSPRSASRGCGPEDRSWATRAVSFGLGMSGNGFWVADRFLKRILAVVIVICILMICFFLSLEGVPKHRSYWRRCEPTWGLPAHRPVPFLAELLACGEPWLISMSLDSRAKSWGNLLECKQRIIPQFTNTVYMKIIQITNFTSKSTNWDRRCFFGGTADNAWPVRE